MAITYTWNFTQFDIAPTLDTLTNVVMTVHWRYYATDGVHTVSNYGTVALPAPTTTEFVNYEHITEELAILWMQSAMDVPALESNLAAQIADLQNPPIISVIPSFNTNVTGNTATITS